MKIENYPKITVIMRGYTYEQALLIIRILSNYDHKVGVEVTTNNPDYLDIIKDGNEKYGDQVYIGVGTVLKKEQAQNAIDSGAKFMLGPAKFTDDIFALAQREGVITVPGAMTPSEIVDQFERGADIVKIFPAITTGASYFKELQGPLGKQKLMAVGGVNIDNARVFFDKGASYLGIGSSFFNKLDVQNMDDAALTQSVEAFLKVID